VARALTDEQLAAMVTSDARQVEIALGQLIDVKIALEPLAPSFSVEVHPHAGVDILVLEASTAFALRATLGPFENTMALLLPRGDSVVRQKLGGRQNVLDATVAAVYAPGDRVVLETAQRASATILRISAELLTREWQELAQTRAPIPALPRALDVRSGPGRIVAVLIAQLGSDPALSSMSTDPRTVRWLERMLAQALLLDAWREHGPVHHNASRASLQRVEEYAAAHLGDLITLGDLARVAGVSARSLQLEFHRRRGVPPMAWLREQRLERVRAELLRGVGTVSEIALRYGFTHLGRFAEAYRQRFGEAPSQTLRPRPGETPESGPE
jgi:AraC-like DNA-binding protein